jgi:hypothetical protein
MISEYSINRILSKVQRNNQSIGSKIQEEGVKELIPILEEYVWKTALDSIEQNKKEVSIPLFGKFKHKLSLNFSTWFKEKTKENPVLYFITLAQKKKIKGAYCECVKRKEEISIDIEALLGNELEEIKQYVKGFDRRIITNDELENNILC